MLLSVRGLTRSFGGLLAVDEVDLDVEPGRIVGIIGPNGAGKTTLLNCISGMLRADRGTVTFDGQRIERLRPHRITRLGVGRTLQLAEHFKNFTVVDFVMLGRQDHLPRSIWVCGLNLGTARRRGRAELAVVRSLLERYELADVGDTALRELPYGTQRLADLVRALAGEPRLLLLDEPTSGSSEYDRAALRRYLGTLRDEALTTVVVDHDVRFVSDTCDSVVAMALGRRLCTGTPAEVLADPAVVASYLGSERQSLIEVAGS